MAQREGYLMVDHRASPGIPEDAALQLGLDPKLVASGKLLEAATLTCTHCKCSVMKNPYRTRERGSCPKCNLKYVCDICAVAMRQPDYNHLPYEKRLDDAINDQHRLELYGSPTSLLMPKD